MYLTDLLIMNSGAIHDLRLKLPFSSDGAPKPLILVGTNGSGKTGVLSTIADAIIELAAEQFDDVSPTESANKRRFFRILGGRTRAVDAPFELLAAKFAEGEECYFYRALAGSITSEEVSDAVEPFGPLSQWQAGDEGKIASLMRVHGESLRLSLRHGVHLFFPSSRYETPYWANVGFLERDPNAEFTTPFSDKLLKPIILESTIQGLKPWIIDIMLDRSIDIEDILQQSESVLRHTSLQTLQRGKTYGSLRQIVRKILKKPNAQISRVHRVFMERRICVAENGRIVLPTLDNLSAGQATLLGMFGSILRYGEVNDATRSAEEISGIVLIDEVDAHLHADLQYEVLPELIAMFPKVQFIISSHAPLFPLGMQKRFGEDGFVMVELPSGLTIDPERFSEFAASMAYFRSTQTFEAALKEKPSHLQRPVVLCEGQTDPRYLSTAAEVLGMTDLATQVDFDWVGQKATGGAQGGGKDNLDSALKFLKHNPQILGRRAVLLFDCDAPKQATEFGDIAIRSLPINTENNVRKRGIENMLPPDVFENRFFQERCQKSGDDDGTIRVLNKTALCDHICSMRKPEHFEKFHAPLAEIEAFLLPKGRSEAS